MLFGENEAAAEVFAPGGHLAASCWVSLRAKRRPTQSGYTADA